MSAIVLSPVPFRVRQLVRSFVRGDLGHRVTDETRLEGLPLDSLDRVALAVELEEMFGIAVSDDEAGTWTKIGDIIGTVCLLTGQAA
jgi:acyl carrier protein